MTSTPGDSAEDHAPHENTPSTLNALQQLLAKFDEDPSPIDELAVDSAIQMLRPKDDKQWEPPFEIRAERIAFFFDERFDETNEAYKWYAPTMSGTRRDGSRWESPSIKDVDEPTLDYWTERAKQAKHPVMRSRYAGLVWEFAPVIRGTSADIEIARIFIDAVIAIAKDDLHEHETDACRQLAHALSVAIGINDQERIARVRDTILDYEAKVGDDDKPGLWGNSFDLLYGHKKVDLSVEQEAAIIQDLEDRLERLSNPEVPDGNVDPWAAEAAAQRLAYHFQRLNQKEDVRRVLQKVERAFNHFIGAGAAAMVSQAWFEQIERLYRHFGLSEDASNVRRRIHDLGPAARDELVPMEHKFKINQQDVEGYVNAILEGDIESAIKRFVEHHIPHREQTVGQLMKLKQGAPLHLITPQHVLDGKGRPIATIGPLDEDLDGRVAAQTVQNAAVTGVFLRRTVEEMIKRFRVNGEVVLEWIGESPIFEEAKYDLLRRGLDAYFDSDPVFALHLLVPQVEAAIRNLLVACGGDVYRPNPLGGMHLRAFGDVLRDPLIEEALSSDVAEYFRILYTDIRGFNLRNDLCHGLLSTERFNMRLADLVFHTLVLLTMFREAESAEEHGQSNESGSHIG